MVVVVSQDGDSDAAWAAAWLGSRLPQPVEHVTASQLIYGASWRHYIAQSRVDTSISLRDGRLIESSRVGAVLNRLFRVGLDAYSCSPKDLDYATLEANALALSWLGSLGSRVINEPTPTSLAGNWRPSSYWRWVASVLSGPNLAFSASDPASWSQGRPRTVTVIDGEIPGRCISREARTICRQLATQARLALYRARFIVSHTDSWSLADVDPFPRLRGSTESVKEALLRAVMTRATANT